MIHLLVQAFNDGLLSPAAQAERWVRLSRWRSNRDAKEEIAAIYNARTRGR